MNILIRLFLTFAKMLDISSICGIIIKKIKAMTKSARFLNLQRNGGWCKP